MTDLDVFHGPNAGYVLDLYERYLEDPDSVDAATRALFDAWTADTGNGSGVFQNDGPAPATAPSVQANGVATVADYAETPPPVQEPGEAAAAEYPTNGLMAQADPVPAPAQPANKPAAVPFADIPPDEVDLIVHAARLVRLIRELGHLEAHIDPLGSEPPGDPGLELETHNLTTEALAALPANVVSGPLSGGAQNALEAIGKLRRAYSGPIGYEDDHVQNHEERQWMRDAVETGRFFQDIDDQRKRELLERLTEVETFERFLHQTYTGQKRFSLEGNDMLVPIIDSIIRNAASSGTLEIVLGMAHRGRLNVLAHVLGKPYSAILAEFQRPNYYHIGTYQGWAGDVKYHLGARRAYRESGVFEMPLTLVPNPSHLEYVNPVVQGRARAAQERRDQASKPTQDFQASLPVVIHGDAAFPGQGVVAETLNLSRLAGYSTGGTIHIIINNQIGFTTSISDSRSTLYASDLAKGFEIPIVHVNADAPLACIAAARMAWAYRERFKKDFLIDLVGYRRWGHNEGDEPAFTQPLMYMNIAKHPTVRELWARELERQGVMTRDEIEACLTKMRKRLELAVQEVEKRGRIDATVAVSAASLFRRPVSEAHHVSARRLLELNEVLLRRPEGFTPHSKLDRLLQRRRSTITQDGGIDWGHAESLAFATILADGIPIRLTGQDSERGTFSHRHLVLYDPTTGEKYVPLQELPQARASFAIHNSPLSESAALGFEYGYSTHAPDTLVLWEAQFGDFANSAQVFIDQFIVAGHAKWNQLPSLVLLLPHGYEGQGPEHSSARVERFLQLAADNNIRIVNCTTAAQYFHLLRRQATTLHSDPRPLIVLTPKSLLRHPRAGSSLADLAEGRFHPVLPPEEGSAPPEEVKRLILCSGKVYVDLISSGEVDKATGVAVARVEELYPFPQAELETLFRGYPELREIVWLQEEPYNMGAWTFVSPRLQEMLQQSEMKVIYCGRPESASTAEGSLSQHEPEQARILHDAVHGMGEKQLTL